MRSKRANIKERRPHLFHSILATGRVVLLPFALLPAIVTAQTGHTRSPDVVNNLPIRPNPTAAITPICHKLGEKKYSLAFQASCYSEFKQAVVILMSGNAKDHTGQQIAEFVVGEFGKSHVPAVAFLRFPEWDEVAMTFLLNGDAYGPYSGKNWREGFEILKIHSAQAWHK